MYLNLECRGAFLCDPCCLGIDYLDVGHPSLIVILSYYCRLRNIQISVISGAFSCA